MKMPRLTVRFDRYALAMTVLVLAAGGSATVEPTGDLRPAQYAPIVDLTTQVDTIVKAVEKDLADETDYTEDHQNRIFLNAHTLIALGRTLANHDENHPRKAAAAGLIATAAALADAVEDYSEAKQSLTNIQKSLAQPAGEAADSDDIVPDLQALMKQVPIVNNSLRRGVMGKRFERMIDHCAGEAVALAAIAQVSMSFTDYCEDDEAHVKWAQICADMRNAAAEVHTAVRKKDLPAATAGLAKIVETCDACHHAFRD